MNKGDVFRPIAIGLVSLGILGGAAARADAAPVGPGFAYQGVLRNANGPVNGVCDLQLSLWDSVAAATGQAGVTEAMTATVTNGLFSSVLNAGGAFGAGAFTGDARWLQTAVRCPAGGAGAFATLLPRQALYAAPYAHSLRPGATVNGLNNTGSESFGSTTRQMLNLWESRYGIGVQSYAMYFRTDYDAGFAWYEGGAHSDQHGDPGPQGGTLMTLDHIAGLNVTAGITTAVNDPNRSAVYGENRSQGGNGVMGVSRGCDFPEGCSHGAGVVGTNLASGPGVEGTSAQGNGVLGYSGAGAGVVGQSNTGAGVYGGSNSGIGVSGRSTTGYAGSFEGKVRVNGDIVRAYTAGSTNRATPVAYANIDMAGPVLAGSANVSCAWKPLLHLYEITLAGEAYGSGSYVTVITANSGGSLNGLRIPVVGSSGGKLLVTIFDTYGNAVQGGFQFIVYKP